MERTFKSPRAQYGTALAELGKINKNIVVMDADLSCSTQTKMFAKEFPERFFNVGIAEQDLMATAAGLASVGKIPFVSTFAMFASGRAWEQIRIPYLLFKTQCKNLCNTRRNNCRGRRSKSSGA